MRAWFLEALLETARSVFSGHSSLVSEAPYGWLGTCCSANLISPPPDLTQGQASEIPNGYLPNHVFQSCFTNNTADSLLLSTAMSISKLVLHL